MCETSGAGAGNWLVLSPASQTLDVLRTRAEPLGIHLVVEPVTAESIAAQPDLFGVLMQFPGASGAVRDLAPAVGFYMRLMEDTK